MTRDITIKCGNIAAGVYLYDDIKERLNTRLLNGSIARIENICDDGETWVNVTVYFHHSFVEHLMEDQLKYIQGMVAGILLWSGVEVI
jgi:hypothetical protein